MKDGKEYEAAGSSNLEWGLDHIEKLCEARGFSRRDFLKISGIVVAGMALPFACHAPREESASGFDDIVELPKPPAPAGDVTVGMVRGGAIAETVRRAIALAGGLDEIHDGETVVIKPNLTTASALSVRVTTHPEVLRAVIGAVKERTDASNITVAEASAFTDPSTLEVARAVGVYDVVQSEGVNFLAWEDEEYVEATSYDFKNMNYHLWIPVSLTDSRFDHFINVPMLKNHEAIKNSNADYTCCLKNHVGVLMRDNRTGGGTQGIHTADLGEKIAELNLAVPVHTMNVVDALTVILTGGPASRSMDSADPGLILACRDRVACDSLGLAVLRYHASLAGINKPYVGKSVWQQAQIMRAQELNLGRYGEDIKIAGDGVDDMDAILDWWN